MRHVDVAIAVHCNDLGKCGRVLDALDAALLGSEGTRATVHAVKFASACCAVSVAAQVGYLVS